MTATDLTSSVTISPDLPWFQGHFPGDPILPGIVQLKMVADIVAGSEQQNIHMTGMSRVKFRKTVRPKDHLDIRITCEKRCQQYRFMITCGAEEVCSGKMYFTNN
ncbi:3-hydroxyacyl-ACP dehydratase FabZ family protein [Desulfogranum japonicum]|uniref:3-hydroxyacyl-ACP dehydratase FabZ family protein n=1 Tax=Desulfogranum japonicum TaxID=231447 RepID=UPI000552C8B0|nr:hypothetical protein [Desulfogranum japonicum]